MSALTAGGFAEAAVRSRARLGAAAAFPPLASYGAALFGADGSSAGIGEDRLDAIRLVPPVFMPGREAKLVELGREPGYDDVDLSTTVGGFRSPLPTYVSAFGSTAVASGDLGCLVSRQAGRLGVPMVIGENIVPVSGYGRLDSAERSMLGRVRAYAECVPDGLGGVVIQQSTEDADAEVWNLVYSDPAASTLLDSGRLGFELKTGQGAKPGLGGMTLLPVSDAARLSSQYHTDAVFGETDSRHLRSSHPGTFTAEILRQQVRLMRNNYPRARVWVKLHPGRDVAQAAGVAWAAGADAVTVDGAEGGTGWAPTTFLNHVGLPLAECLDRIGRPTGCLLTSGRIWEGARAVKCLALGARAVGLGRAALLAVDENPSNGLVRLLECLALEVRLLVSALGKYEVGAVDADDIWNPFPASKVTSP